MGIYSIAIIGGGAAGICAAIQAARSGHSVIICDRMPQLGKKILATGNGRCNLLNDNISADYYNSAAKELVNSIFSRVSPASVLEFFNGIGLQFHSQQGRIFPVTNQAASVLKVLEIELKRLSVTVAVNFHCSGLSFSGDCIQVLSLSGQKIDCQKVIITGGGKTYPAYGSDGSTCEIARQLGHTIVEPVPAVVPLVIKDNLCQVLQGQRIQASAWSIIQGREGKAAGGELLFTKYGLSGTCILDISDEISLALNRRRLKEVYVSVDMVPFLDRKQLQSELEWRRNKQWAAAEMLVGILPNKLGTALHEIFAKDDLAAAVASLKARRFRVEGTRGWNEAEFTCGGVAVDEVDKETLESKIKRGVFFAGEVLDVNGPRGGYNLGWAWASGLVAGG